MIKKIFNIIEDQNLTILGFLLSFVSILFVRFIFEAISSPSASGIIPSDPYTLVHYALYFLVVTLISIIVMGYFIQSIELSAKYVLFGLPLIWIAPIVDILISGGRGLKMTYIFDTGKNLLYDFFTFFGPNLSKGATYGIRLVILISIIGIAYITFLKNKDKKIINALKTFFIIYFFVFIFASLPGIIFTFSGKSGDIGAMTYFEKLILQSNISHNTLREGFTSVEASRFIEIGFDKLMSQILFLVSLLLTLILFYKCEKQKTLSVIKNIRIERVNFYTLSILSGMGFAWINGLGNLFVWVDFLSIFCLVVAWMCLWMHAVHLNDIYDLSIDKISNKERPLVKNALNEKEMKEVGVLWLLFGLLGAWSVGYYMFFMALVYVGASFVYSVPPLRLRRFPLVPSFLIGTACLSTVLAGFYLISADKSLQIFPKLLAVGIVALVTMAINFKDIKDIEGDRENDIMTIPNIFPKYGVKIVAILFALSILLVPLILSFYLLFIFSLPLSIIGYWLIVRKPYVEKYIFILRFFFLFFIAISYLFVYWYANVKL